MKNEKNKIDKDLCRIITPEFRVSYPHVFNAQAPKPADTPKFSITMLFPKDRELIGQSPEGKPRSIKEVIRNAKIAKFGPKENWPEDIESPVRDGDHKKTIDKLGYAGSWVIKATSSEDQRPEVVGPDADDYGKLVPLTKPSELYPGCYARAYVFARCWEYMGKEGVQFILDHVQKLRDGTPFGGKRPVDQVFSPVEADGDDFASEADDDDDEVADF